MAEYLKFAWIALCFAAALASWIRCAEYRDWSFLTMGMGFTLLADYYLILRNEQVLGTLVFCFVHAAYILRTQSINKKWLLFAPAVLLAGFISANPLLAAAFTYAVLSAIDIAAHILMYKRNTRLPKFNKTLALTGILLFALCDVNVLLYNLPRFVPAFKGFERTAFILLWVFYIPSQAVIAISGLKFFRRTR